MSFSWIPFYEELANKLLDYENRQKEMVDLLIKAGVNPNTLHDRPEKDNEIPLEEIDPFTFFSQINKHGKDNLLKILNKLTVPLNLNTPIPIDIDGIPVPDRRNACYFSWILDRTPEDIPTLWEIFKAALNNSITNELFYRALNIKQVGLSKLTMGLFWVRPNQYLSLDASNIPYLIGKGIMVDKEQLNSETGYDYYQQLLQEIKVKFENKPLPEISLSAYLDLNQQAKSGREPSLKYWLYAPGPGAMYWQENQEKGIMAIGWDDLGDFKQYPSHKDIHIKMNSLYQSNPKHDSLACWEFCNVINIGDYVFAKEGRGKIIGYGVVESDYIYDDSRTQFKNVRKVRWIESKEWDMPDDNALVTKTLTQIEPSHPLFNRLKQILDGKYSLETDIHKEKSSAQSYYWLNANPKIWSLKSLPVGETVSYTTINEDGHKRQIFSAFQSVKPGDLAIGYSTSPDRSIICLCDVVQGIHQEDEQECISFKKIVDFANPIPWDEVKNLPHFISDSDTSKNNHFQGSLFSISEIFFLEVINLIRVKNPSFDLNNLPQPAQPKPYTLEEAMKGLFMDEEEVMGIVKALQRKMNIVLQGPPGVGKSFIARRIAYLLMEEEAPSQLEVVQFHQSYGYEDFIQGYRPNGNNGFKLEDGIFYKFCQKAKADPEHKYVFIIDEINRGNLSRIFGEVLTLLEDDKRGEEWAVALSYDQQKFFVPSNVYIIGLMNTADRSLALVDFALRRRFSFKKLNPAFNHPQFKEHLQSHSVEENLIDGIIKIMGEINKEISQDTSNLGEGFQIGHSYFCPKNGQNDGDWYQSIVRGEIAPLLEEYYFDDPKKAKELAERLLKIDEEYTH